MTRKHFFTFVRRFGIGGIFFMLTGCGLSQTVKEGTISMTQAVFYKQVKDLHLDFQARAAINISENKAPLATVVRVYQLKDRKAFDAADYYGLLQQADVVLKGDMLAHRDVLMMPQGAVSLDMPLNNEAKFIAVVGLFRAPDMQKDNWRLVLEREELEPEKARTIEVGDGQLTLLTLTK